MYKLASKEAHLEDNRANMAGHFSKCCPVALSLSLALFNLLYVAVVGLTTTG